MNLDLTGVFQLILDLFGNVPGQQDHLVLADLLGLDHDADLTARLNGDLNKALDSTAVKKRMADFSMEAMPGTPEQFKAFARAESKRWGEIIRTANIRLD